jgi:hypothetical protein
VYKIYHEGNKPTAEELGIPTSMVVTGTGERDSNGVLSIQLENLNYKTITAIACDSDSNAPYLINIIDNVGIFTTNNQTFKLTVEINEENNTIKISDLPFAY